MRTPKIVVALLFVVSSITVALAHAHLDHAEPPVDGTVHAPPHQLTLWFTKALEPAVSGVDVANGAGASVSDGSAQIDGNVMRVGLKPLTAGSYTVHWHAVATDTHRTEGTFSFTVAAP